MPLPQSPLILGGHSLKLNDLHYAKVIFLKIELDFFCKLCFSELLAKAKPAARWGRKTSGLLKGEEKIAGLPG
jgi:hypothetical protein